jgi:hypothetical protein
MFKGKLVTYDSMSKTIYCYCEDGSYFLLENVPEGKVEATPHACITVLPPVDAFEEITIVGNELWYLKIPISVNGSIEFIEKYIIHKSPRCSDCANLIKQLRETKNKLQEIEELWYTKTSQ